MGDDGMGLTTEDLQSIAKLVNDSSNLVLGELGRVEQRLYKKIDEKIKSINDKIDTLLLKADNTALLLPLINKQAAELEAIKVRMNELEEKIS